MALRTCRECGGQVSTNAKACPHCGSKSYSTQKMVEQFANALIMIGVMIFLLMLCLGLLGGALLLP